MSLEHGGSPNYFSRLKAIWGKAAGQSFYEYGNWDSAWVEDEVLEFAHRGKKGPQRLRMVDLQQCVKDLVYGLQPALEKLLPGGMELPSSQAHHFVGNIYPEETFFVDSQISMDIMAPLYKAFKDGHNTTTASLPSAVAWLKNEKGFLGHLLATLLISGGVSPRTTSAQACRIRGLGRNIFHAQGSTIWISSRPKVNSATCSSNGLWAFPSQVAWPLYFYLGVVRPFSAYLLESIGHKPDSDILRDYLFVYTSTSTSQYTQKLWARRDTKQVIAEYFADPLDLNMDCFDLRQILQAVANRQLVNLNGSIHFD